MKLFTTPMDQIVPAVTRADMADVDAIATRSFGIDLLQMMENAGRAVAKAVWSVLPSRESSVTVLSGGGGNGGGGLAAARHLRNRGVKVRVVLDRDHDALRGAAARQWTILERSGVGCVPADRHGAAIASADVVVDALIGYGLEGAPRGRTAELIELCNRRAKSIVSVDLPSGIDATVGRAAGVVARPDRIVTLALPKTGLAAPDVDVSQLLLADLGIPPQVFEELGITYEDPFRGFALVPLRCVGRFRRPCKDVIPAST